MELRHIIAAHLHRLHKKCSPWSFEDPVPEFHWLGEYGELIAYSWLASKGYKCLKRRFLWGDGDRRGEIDLVMRDGDALVFIEVKTRSSTEFGFPIEAVKSEKRQMMRRSARYWCMLLGRDDLPLRFDIVEVILRGGHVPELYLHRAAFGMQDGEGKRIERGEGDSSNSQVPPLQA